MLIMKRKKANEIPEVHKVEKLRGIIKTGGLFDIKQVLAEELSKKYGV